MVRVDMGYNPLGGTISPDWVLPTSLKELHLTAAQLSGPLAGLRPPLRLKLLALDFNRLSGTLPKGLTRLRSMQAMNLHHNLLTGQLPANFAFNASSTVKVLIVSSNNFSGERVGRAEGVASS